MNVIRSISVGSVLLYALLFGAVNAHAQYGAKPFQDPATGETYHVEGSWGLWNPPPDLIVASESLPGIVGTQISAVQDLGIQRHYINELKITLRPAKKHKFRLDYLPMTYTAQNSLHRQFVFNGISYNANLPVSTELAWKTWMLGYEYDFLYKDRWFAGFVAQVKATDVEINLASPIGSDFVIAKAPIPNFGGIARVYLVPNISVTGEVVGIKIPDSISEDYRAHYVDFNLYGTVNFNNYVGAQLGYRSFDVGYRFDRDEGTFKMKGLYFGGVVRY